MNEQETSTMPPIESLSDFTARHGQYVEIDFGVRLFADGAIASDGGREGLPTRREPPSDSIELLRLQRRFAEASRHTSPVRTYPDFEQLHGGQPVFEDGRFIFPDGTQCDRSRMFLTEPPSDPVERLRARRLYVAAKLRAEVQDFEAFKSDCLEKVKWAAINPSCCPPPPDAAEQLTRGKARIDNLRNELGTIDQQLGAAPQESAKQAHQQFEQVRRHKLGVQLKAIDAVTLD